jgi:hypothetical protein
VLRVPEEARVTKAKKVKSSSNNSWQYQDEIKIPSKG